MTVETVPLKLLQPSDFPHRLDHRIVKAAVKVGDTVYTAWRHSDIWTHLITRDLLPHTFDARDGDNAGFICNQGAFHTRYMACKIALGSRQVEDKGRAVPHLMSEKLWDEVEDKGGAGHRLMSEELWDKDGVPRVPGVPYHPCS